ncbi:MAG: type III pantothenate kinase [Thermoflexibacteraceae bacterium]
MKLLIDIGNTFVKIGFFENNLLGKVAERLTMSAAIALLKNTTPETVVLCDVANKAAELLPYLPQNSAVQQLSYQTKVPIQNLYETPQTLGMDRLAAVLGAYHLFPNKNCLVIDAGSCITYDFLTATGSYLGGAISLGLQLRFRALHEYTAKLPLLQATDQTLTPIGKNTTTAIQSGVIVGLTEEIKGFTRYYEQNFGELQVIFCGGDAQFLAAQLPHSNATVQPYLLLYGLATL